MYSPDGRKEWYLEECRKNIYEESTVTLVEKIFESTEIEEKVFEKDVCDFTDAEVVDMFKSFNTISRVRLKATAWYLSRYHQWCYDKGLTQKIDDAYDGRTIENTINSVIPSYLLLELFFNKNELLDILNLEPDYINRFILIAPYYGIKGDDYCEMLNLKITDLDKENKCVNLITNRKAYVDDVFIEIMTKAYETKEYKTNIPFVGKNYKLREYSETDYIIRACLSNIENTNKPVNQRFIDSRIQKIKKEYGYNFISISSLYKNGLINYISEKYKKKDIKFSDALMDYSYDKETQTYIDEFGSKSTTRLLRMQLKDVIDKI